MRRFQELLCIMPKALYLPQLDFAGRTVLRIT